MTVTSTPDLSAITRRNAEDIKYIVLHHSATQSGNVAVFRDYHLKQGFADIGYHYVICNGQGGKAGEVQEGRPVLMTGAHAIERNSDSIGICLVGDFTQSEPTEAQITNLYKLMRILMRQYPVGPERILAHKEVCPTSCPGILDVAAIRATLAKPAKDYEDHLHKAAIEEAIRLKLMAGYADDIFRPDQPCTRAELAAVAVRTYHEVLDEIVYRIKGEDNNAE